MPENNPGLDQALDPLAPLYENTATGYDAYLRSTYGRNLGKFSKDWSDHFGDMRKATLAALWRNTETTGKRRKETSMMLMGPGFDMMQGRDLDQLSLDVGIGKLRNLTVVDFSMNVIRDAVLQLQNAGATNVSWMQYDITGGLSTAYQRYWEDEMRGVDSEVQLLEVILAMRQRDTIAELEGRLMGEMRRATTEQVRSASDLPPQASWNLNRSLKLSMSGKPLPIDYVQTNMVLAGTGETGESKFWEVFRKVTGETDSAVGTERISESILTQRRRILEAVHQVFADYNTGVFVNATKQILKDNPLASVQHITDVSTTFEDDAFDELGSLPRLMITDAQDRLREAGIVLRDNQPVKSWVWKDEQEPPYAHHHSVHAMFARRDTIESQPIPL